MTSEQELFVAMLEDKGLCPNLSMTADGDWDLVEIDIGDIGLTFTPDGKLIKVDID